MQDLKFVVFIENKKFIFQRMCGLLVDRSCWVFIVQALISVAAIGSCVFFIGHSTEVEWAKNILVMVLSVWFPSPTVGGLVAISQNADNNKTISPRGAAGRRWRVKENVQGEIPRSGESGPRDDEELKNQQKQGVPTIA